MIAALQAAVRPLVTIVFALLFVGIVLLQINVPERAWSILETVLLFYFIARGADKAADKVIEAVKSLNNQSPNDPPTIGG